MFTLLEPLSWQEEYVDGDDLGALDCGHDFHTSCIKQWLKQKNLCPICKTTALPKWEGKPLLSGIHLFTCWWINKPHTIWVDNSFIIPSLKPLFLCWWTAWFHEDKRRSCLFNNKCCLVIKIVYTSAMNTVIS